VNLKQMKVAVAGAGAAGLVLGGLTVGGVTFASPSSSTVYSACVSKIGDTLYDVTANGTPRCRSGDTLISWNAQGPKGTTGPQGPKGTTGPPGPKGTKGTTGPQGPKGTKGTTGPQGPKGTKGTKGTTGPKGTKGTTGPAGPEYVASGIILGTGAVDILSKSPGVSVTVTHKGTGVYGLNASGLGTSCVVPSLTAVAASYTIDYASGGCGAGTVTTDVYTNNGTNEDWSFLLVGTDPPSTQQVKQGAIHFPS
jgi:hypothetical protein